MYEHSELANPTLSPRRRIITGGSSSQSFAVRGPSRTFSAYNAGASVHRYVRLAHISDSTTKNGVNQEARFPKKKRSTPKQTGQTLLENWQRKSDARSFYDCLLPGHIAADCNTDKGKAAALRVILEWLASTHEAVLPKHDSRSAVRAWYWTNGVDFGRHDTNVLSLMTAAVNKAGLAVPKAGIPAVKRAVGRKTNPVNAVSSEDDSTSESSSSSSCYIDFSFTRAAEEATIEYAGLQKTSGDTHRCLHSMLDLGNPHVLAGAEWWKEEYMPRLLACGWDPIKEVTSSTTSGCGDGPQSTLLSVAKGVPFRLRHHDGSTTLSFSDVAIAPNEVGLLAGKCDMAALLTDIQMSPTLTTYRMLHNTSPIVLVDSGGHLFARLPEPTMAEPGKTFVFLRKKKNGAVFAKVKTAPENSPAPITNPRVDVSVTNGGSPWDTAARLDVLPTDSKQFDKTSKKQCTSSVCILLLQKRWWVACPTLVSMYRTMSLSQTSSRMTTRHPCLKIWPSLLSRRTRSHWLTCPRCTVPWTIPAARSLLTSSFKR
jgi:hypothetical protein